MGATSSPPSPPDRAVQSDRPPREEAAGVVGDQHVATADVEVEVLEYADLLMPAHDRAAIAGKLDEVDRVEHRDGAGEVGGEDEARLERCDEHRFAVGVIARDLRSELPD